MRSVKIEIFSFYGTLPLLFAYLLPMRNIYLLFTKKVCEGNVFTGVCPWGGVSQHALGRGCLPSGLSAQGTRGRQPFPARYYGIRSTSGRYASYWNAFLLHIISPSNTTGYKKWMIRQDTLYVNHFHDTICCCHCVRIFQYVDTDGNYMRTWKSFAIPEWSVLGDLSNWPHWGSDQERSWQTLLVQKYTNSIFVPTCRGQ